MRTGPCKVVFCCAWRSYAQLSHLKEKHVNKFSRTARSVTFAAIVGLSLGVSAPGALAIAEEAQAAGVVKANIDFDKTGSITIFKRDLNGGIAVPGIGKTIEDPDSIPGKALQGVEFKVEKVLIDLKDSNNWKGLKDLTAAEALKKGVDPQKFDNQTTGPDGKATFSDLPVGIYVVTEVKAPTGVIKGAPFVVSVPFTDAEGTAWNYNPVVYPKNTKAEATKTVEDSKKNAGEKITYKVKTPIPTLAEGKHLKKYVITDDYAEDKVKVEEGNEVKLFWADGQEVSAALYDLNRNDGGKLVVTFKSYDELEKHQGEQITTSIQATVNEDFDGEIKNSAKVLFNNPNSESDDDDVDIPTNEVFTYYGNVKVVKKDETKPNKVLKGAEFKLYRSEDAQCTDEDEELFGGKTFATDDKGELTVHGLHVTNVEDSDKPISHTYCLKETKAPEGYVTPTGAKAWIPFELKVEQKKDVTGQKVVEGSTIQHVSKEVTNRKDNTPKLPMTGGAGVGILAAIGAAIIGAGAWFARRNSAEA